MPLLLVLIAVLALPTPAAASHRGDLWATVNVCDSPNYPNVLGVRASMPGNGTRQTMWMRFRAMYFDRAEERWRQVGGSGTSPWIKVGNARYRARQAGRRFTFDPPLPTTSHVLRGEVRFQWRRKRKVRGKSRIVKRARTVTLAGHPTGRFGDPYDYSYGVCEITFP